MGVPKSKNIFAAGDSHPNMTVQFATTEWRGGQAMRTSENKAIITGIWEAVLNKGEFDRIYDFYGKSHVYHGSGHEVRGPDNLKKFLAAARRSVPDVHYVFDDLIADGDRVVSRCTAPGTVRPSDKHIQIENLLVSRIADGKVVEEWETIDRLAIAQQLPGVGSKGDSWRST
jgi:predicted ester cyclase